VVCVLPLILDLFLTQLTFHLGGHTSNKHLSWDILRDYRSCSNESSTPNFDSIEHNGTDANQTTSLKTGAMNNRSMSNRHVFSNVNGEIWIAVQNSSILNNERSTPNFDSVEHNCTNTNQTTSF
jgi:hypothetical protein